MTSIPDIDTDRLAGFKKMAHAVVDDLVEAASDMASRHTHQVDLLKARVVEQDETIEKQRAAVTALRGQMNDAAAALGEAIGADVSTLAQAVPAVVAKLQAMPAPQFFGLTVADLAEVLKEESAGEHDAAVAACLEHDDGDIAVVDTVRNLCSEVRRLRLELDVATAPKKARRVAVVADLPVEAGPFVVTMKTPHGRRFLISDEGGVSLAEWSFDLEVADLFPTRARAEAVKPRRSAVVTLADAHELIEAEKVSTIAPSAAAPGPEAA
jgi:hypothetical protein